MAHLPLDELLENAEIASSMDPGLYGLIQELRASAEDRAEAQLAHFETFDITVTPGGEVMVDTTATTAFGDWVWAAGELARHVGPQSGTVRGEVTTVAAMLGSEDDEPDGETPDPGQLPPPAPAHPLPGPASPLEAATVPGAGPRGSAPVQPQRAYRCSRCGALHADVPSGGGCPACGGPVTLVHTVRCPDCSAVILLA